MDDVLEGLRRLPDTPPVVPEPMERLRRRAADRRRRRFVRVGMAATAAVVISAGGLVPRLADRRPSPVAVEVGDRVGSSTTVPPTIVPPTTSKPAPVTPVTAPGRPEAWRIPASISASFLPGAVGAVAAGNLILVPGGFDEGGVTAYDSRSGERRWRYEVGADAFVSGVGEDIAIVAPQYGGLGAVELATGRERWRTSLPDGASAGRATIAGSRVYLGASHPSEGSVAAPFVLALDASTGRPVWTATLDAGTQLQPVAPVVSEGTVFVADLASFPGSAPTSHLHALAAGTGASRWRADLGSSRPVFHEQAPVLAGSTVYAAGTSGRLLALDPVSGRERWRYDSPSGFLWLASAADDRVIVVTGAGVERLARDDGRTLWRVPTSAPGRPARSWAALAGNDTIVVIEPGRTLAVDTGSGALRWELGVDAWYAVADAVGMVNLGLRDRLLAVDARSGRQAWAGDVQARQDQPALLAGGAVVVTAADGSLAGFAVP